MYYGNAPEVMDEVNLKATEMCFIQYLPIKMPNTDFRLSDNTYWCRPLLYLIDFDNGDYIYLTVKHLWVDNHFRGNRLGWHSDGFMSDDVNYIWYDTLPTEFCIQPFNLSQSHELSLGEMSDQARENNIVTYPNNTLLKLDQSAIHRVSQQPYSGMRTFIKISVSKNIYNLEGNAHNYLFDYSWDMKPRDSNRNHPSK